MRAEIYFAGGAREIGRSCFVLRGKKNLIIDAGIKLGKKIEFPLIEELDYPIVISHAHLDHIGYLANTQPKEKIYTTKPTKDLMPLLLSDYSRISQLSFDTNRLMKKVEVKEYKERFKVNGFSVELFNAGHLLGSAMIKIGELLYTGDFNARGSLLLEKAKPVKAKTLLIESTYAGKEDIIPSFKEEMKRLVAIINKVVKNKGVVLIPAFAAGRAQEILISLERMMRSNAIPRVPIYIDGMIKKAMKIYRINLLYAKKEIQEQILSSLHDPFKSGYFKVSRSKTREDVKKPSIIVTTSGMIVGGPVLYYLKRFAGDENSALVFVGYQAEGTLGREILDGKRRIEIFGEKLELKMEVYRLKISGHSDRNDLIRFINTIKPKHVILVHGEEKKQKELSSYLSKRYNVDIPKVGESLSIEI